MGEIADRDFWTGESKDGGSPSKVKGTGAQLEELQLEQLRGQVALEEKLLPLILERGGIITDPETGDYIEKEDDPDSLSSLLEARAIAAVKGETPISAGLTHQLDNERRILEEGLSQKLGSNYAQTTPGIQSLQASDITRGVVEGSARRADLGLVDTLGSRTATLKATEKGYPQYLQNLGGKSNSMIAQMLQYNAQKAGVTNSLRMQQEAINQQGKSSLYSTIGSGLGIAAMLLL